MSRLLTHLLVTLGLCLSSTVALAFPENVRLGYQDCRSCHVATTGGGALTNYGRSVSEETATFAYEGAGRPAGVLTLPEWAAVGGDVRYVKTPAGTSFAMQRDIELALRPAPYLWVTVSGGLYGDSATRQLRRSYVLWTPTDALSLRVGRFTPAYGVNTPDHTLATRRGLGWDQGSERYTVETALRSSLGELVLTSFVGGSDSVALSELGYHFKADEAGATARLSLNVGDRSQTGLSYWYCGTPQRDWLSLGWWAQAALSRRWYLLADVSRLNDTNGAWLTRAYSDLGSELVRGVHLRLRYQYDDTHRVGAVFQWLPWPHWELLAQTERRESSWYHTLVAHWWF